MSINHENQITEAIMLYSYKCIFILKMESPILSLAKILLQRVFISRVA